MGKHLTDDQIERLRQYLSVYLSLPFVNDLAGEALEEILSLAVGGQYQGKRANRPEPDMVWKGLNYSIKTEKKQDKRIRAGDVLGATEDIITARVALDFDYSHLTDDELGAQVLKFYNTRVVDKYQWDRISILFRFQDNTEFIYIEEPAVHYDPEGYTWRPTGRGDVGKRNIAAYDSNGRQVFRWNSGTTLLYVVHHIPKDADLFTIEKRRISFGELAAAISKDPQLSKAFSFLSG